MYNRCCGCVKVGPLKNVGSLVLRDGEKAAGLLIVSGTHKSAIKLCLPLDKSQEIS